MKRVRLTSEWLKNWSPTEQEEVADAGCPGLFVRGGPRSPRTFYRWEEDKHPETGARRRKRVVLGRWSPDGGAGGAISLAEARAMFLEGKEVKDQELMGVAEPTVADLALTYKRNILDLRKTKGSWSWGTIRTHIIPARPDGRLPPFGDWIASRVKPADIVAVVEIAKAQRREIRNDVARRLGGRAAGRAVLAELTAIFANAVATGRLPTSPAFVVKAKALGLRKPRRGRYLGDDEIKVFFDALDLNRLLDGTAKRQKLSEAARLGLAFLLYVPVRSHSLIGAEWSEVDLQEQRWTVPVTRQKLTVDAAAEARPFVAPLPPTAVAILKRLQLLAGDSRWVLTSPIPPKDDEEPQRLTEKVMIRALARLQATGRLSFGSKIIVHDLRRTWRSKAGDLGVPFEVAEKSLGHTLPGVADIYARGELAEQRAAAAERVAAELDRIRLGTAAQVVPIAAGATR